MILSTFVGVVAVPMAAGTADARAVAHDPAANYTFSPDNHAPGLDNGAAEHYAVGLEKDLTALHTIVVSSDAFNFADCSAAKTTAFGIDRGNDDPGTQTDENLLNKYKSISFQDDKIVVEFYKEEGAVTGSTVGIATDDQIVAAGRDCYDNPDQKGWYQVDGMLNGSTNDDTQTDYEINVKTHYIYVCDCDSRQEAVEKLGPPPSEQDGSSDGGSGDGSSDATATPTAEPTASPTPESSGDAGGSDDGGSSDGGSDTTATPTASPTAGSSSGDGGSSDGGAGGSSDTTTTSTATAATSATAATDTGGTTATAASNQKTGTTPTEGNGPGFGIVAALGGLAALGLLARRD